jgi:two pore calcium channel protein 1
MFLIVYEIWQVYLSDFSLPSTAPRDVVLMFKELNASGSGSLSLEEFYSVYDAAMLKWEAQFSQTPWFHTTWTPLQTFCQFTHDFVTWKYFEYIVCKHIL